MLGEWIMQGRAGQGKTLSMGSGGVKKHRCGQERLTQTRGSTISQPGAQARRGSALAALVPARPLRPAEHLAVMALEGGRVPSPRGSKDRRKLIAGCQRGGRASCVIERQRKQGAQGRARAQTENPTHEHIEMNNGDEPRTIRRKSWKTMSRYR